MSKEKINQEFGMKIIDEIKIYLVEEINLNELMSKNPKNVCTTLILVKTKLL